MICFRDPQIRQSGGVSRILPLGKVTEFEKKLISAALTEIAANIEKVLFLLSERCFGGLVARISQGVSFIKGPKL